VEANLQGLVKLVVKIEHGVVLGGIVVVTDALVVSCCNETKFK